METVGGGSDETLGERKESVSVKTPLVVGEKKKKKVIRVVKKIVKKKVLKKVPKSGSKTSNCDSFGSNDTSVVTGIEKGENVVDLSHWDRIEEPNVAEGKEEEKGVCLVEKERSVTDNDGMEIEKRAGNFSEFENGKDVDACLVERNRDEREINDLVTSYLVSDQNGVELRDGDNNGIELQISDQNRVEDNDTMDVEQHDSGKGVEELVVNSETDGLKLQEGLSESRVLSGQMVASWWHMKQRRKIFVHGLDKETKEEDIRNVFEKIVLFLFSETNVCTTADLAHSLRKFPLMAKHGIMWTKINGWVLLDRLGFILKLFGSIRGSTWHTAAVEANDSIVLNNIDKKWNNENVLSLLQKAGITKIDEVSVVPDPENTELNRGFAFIEFETKRDAQMAYRKLQIKNVFGECSKIKVAWAESLADPVEEEMHNVKSVFAEYIPSSWDEKEVKDHFKMFGEIESIALAKNLHSAKRNDFAFINYKTCEAALSCIEALTNKRSTRENGPKAHPKVSLAKSIPKGKPLKIKSESAVTEVSKVNQLSNQSRPSHIRYQNASQSAPFHSQYQNTSQSRPSLSPYQNASQSRPSHIPYHNASQSRPSHSPYQNASQSRPSHSRYQNADQLRPSQGMLGVYQPQKAMKGEVPSIVRHEAGRKDEGSSTTTELVQLLREQASWKHGGPSSTAGMSTGHPQSQSGGKQLQLPTNLMQGRNALYLDPRSYHQTHLQMPNPTQPRPIVASPHYDQQRARYTQGYNVVEPNPRYIQVQIRVKLHCRVLTENQFKPIIADNFFNPHHFWFELDHAQTNKLLSLLSTQALSGPRATLAPHSTIKPKTFLPLDKERARNIIPVAVGGHLNGSKSLPSNIKDIKSYTTLTPHNSMKQPAFLPLEKESVCHMPPQVIGGHLNGAKSFPSNAKDITTCKTFNEKELITMRLKNLAQKRNLVASCPPSSDCKDDSAVTNNMIVEKKEDKSFPVIAQLVEKVKDLMASKAAQSDKVNHLEQKIASMEQNLFNFPHLFPQGRCRHGNDTAGLFARVSLEKVFVNPYNFSFSFSLSRTESLPNGMFRVRLDNEDMILGHVSGKIRRSFIRILPGDRVKIEVSRCFPIYFTQRSYNLSTPQQRFERLGVSLFISPLKIENFKKLIFFQEVDSKLK
ncbi:nucleotide-binding alpha-beta plait domain-containing protein [Artemisia annua]|uniref:Nucleotide-binding alpha-beta plait domain-containing protein n=1 Tax=Artemisia annua TaxID=35608 RepID=A0A2U1L099_ARTAN|nr:nucleotide-binding alpha-beta plait domain-containing protein [Artemisia annua]